MEMANLADFLALGIRKELLDALKENGITEPTPVQGQTIPVALKGKDVISQAQTGTGKTLAFVLPILEQADPEVTHVQSLILTPTRELALQITAEVKKLTEKLDEIHVLAVYGGQDVARQMRKLEGKKQIVIATPGRLLDHMRRGTIDLSTVSTLVLDEADQMLHMGFLPEVEEIIGQTPWDRQTMLFSATMPTQVRSLANRFMRQPEDIRVQGKRITLDDIKQIVVETTDRAKQTTLRSLLEEHRPFLAVIFCRTKRRASALNAALQGFDFMSDELHGDLSQAKREDVMRRFREVRIQFLVATDVAARGLDVEGVTHVFNYDIPEDVDSYIHRIGRTGRAGERGIAFTLVTPKDRSQLELIEKGIGMSLERQGRARAEESQPREAKHDKTRRRDNASRGAKREQPSGKGVERKGSGFGRKAKSDERQQDRFDRKPKKGERQQDRFDQPTKGHGRQQDGFDRNAKSDDRQQDRFTRKPNGSERPSSRNEKPKNAQRAANSSNRNSGRSDRERSFGSSREGDRGGSKRGKPAGTKAKAHKPTGPKTHKKPSRQRS
ncbi:DEAD/DEAH box helicase [Brevibacillus choshinensis]|uniref:DEAD/DEAH box helicase n=1 Tax=Brevibacillus choshinensis TaxID=54911 RepID=A0ABX7FYD7_BRECH|nr:DEAD/DEAH box helicase [Brevibacillus choshinensis]QRG70841.1 DEAD/DEAH box helicase [Brevibacillus choshinensis]